MRNISGDTPFFLILGDIIAFSISLWVMLIFRYGWDISSIIAYLHIVPFSILFVLWVLNFFIAGLYEKRNSLFRQGFLATLIKIQGINALIAIAFFYFAPFAKIAPKTNLFIYLVISSTIIIWWRLKGHTFFIFKKKETALLLAEGVDVDELIEEINNKKGYGITLVPFSCEYEIDVIRDEVTLIVIDLHNPENEKLHESLYKLIFSRVGFIDVAKLYENVFGRIPLSVIREQWFLENISIRPKVVYDTLKRVMDIVVASALSFITIIIFPLVAIAIKFDSRGPILIAQKRIGKEGKTINIFKFRSMSVNDGGVWVKENDNRITRIGKFLRVSRIDELPQLFSVLNGDMSLIGPRPDIFDLGMQLKKEIPYYTIRNVIKPGLSGWAQIEQELPPQSIEETKMRLAYDFYYIKNRSFLLDVKIGLRTIKTLLSRLGK